MTRAPSRGDEGGGSAGASTEVTNRKVARIRALCKPLRGADESFGQ